MPASFTILGSGSGGNCAYLETGETRILVDAGFSCRQIRQRLAGIGRALENVSGILITHEHSDHIQGLAVISSQLNIPVYCNRATREAIEGLITARIDWRLFETGSSFQIGDVEVDTFSVPHDAQDPVGFLIHTDAGRLGFLTDLGHATRLVIERVRHSNILVLESNHDVRMLQDCPYRPWSLKQRILGRHGHLSNEAAAEAAEQLICAEMKHLLLGHLSRECNQPQVARSVMERKLSELGATHVNLAVLSQTAPAPTLQL